MKTPAWERLTLCQPDVSSESDHCLVISSLDVIVFYLYIFLSCCSSSFTASHYNMAQWREERVKEWKTMWETLENRNRKQVKMRKLINKPGSKKASSLRQTKIKGNVVSLPFYVRLHAWCERLSVDLSVGPSVCRLVG